MFLFLWECVVLFEPILSDPPVSVTLPSAGVADMNYTWLGGKILKQRYPKFMCVRACA